MVWVNLEFLIGKILKIRVEGGCYGDGVSLRVIQRVLKDIVEDWSESERWRLGKRRSTDTKRGM